MTTRGGAGDVLSETGDRRGVVGSPLPEGWPRMDPSDNGEGLGALPMGELGEGEDGPGDEDRGMGGVGLEVVDEGDLDFPSPDLVRERFCIVSIWMYTNSCRGKRLTMG